ncbi:MAG: alpha/beta hydrolase [Pirellulaceae bacterium]
METEVAWEIEVAGETDGAVSPVQVASPLEMATTILVMIWCSSLAIVAVTIGSWFLYVPRVLQVLRGVPWMIAHTYPPAANSNDYDLVSKDGLRLRVSHLPRAGTRCRGAVLFVHGLCEDRWTVMPYASQLCQHGFDVYSFDMRNHGQSEAQENYHPRPWVTVKEVEDVLTVIDFVTSGPGSGQGRVALIGVSKGGNAALCAAARSPEVCAVVTDGAFPTGAMLRHYMRRFMRTHPRLRFLADTVPDVCLISYCAWATFLFRILDHAAVVNVEQAVRRVTQPVFMIHAERDGFVPEQVVRELRRRLSGRSKLWIVPGVNHNGAASELLGEYSDRLVRFLSHRLPCRETEAEHETGSVTRATLCNDVHLLTTSSVKVDA